jgi:membrane protein
MPGPPVLFRFTPRRVTRSQRRSPTIERTNQMSSKLVKQTFSRWSNHEGQRLGAALAFYTLLSAAPLLVFLLLAVSTFLGRNSVEQHMVQYANNMLGEAGANLISTIFSSAHKAHHGTLAWVIAILTLLFGASGVFSELRDDLNKMWDAHPGRRGIWGIVMQRFFAFVLVLAAGLLVFALMLMSTALAFVAGFLRNDLPIPTPLLDAANFVFSLVVLTLVFVLVYRYVPDCRLPWKVLWTGAIVSAILLAIGKALLGWYLGRAGVGSAYGAAGSVIAIAFWIYYCAQIVLLGAEFTYVWSREHRLRAG